jgi:HEAT repeat protein
MFGLPPLPPHFHAALRDVEAKRPESRMAAAERLGRAEGEDERRAALPGLARLAKDAHAGVRAAALAGLGLLADESQLEVVQAGLDDPFPEVREFAALALAQIGGEHALSALTLALTHQAAEVRFHAATALAELDPEHAAPHLIALLEDPDHEVRASAVSALASLGEPHLAGHLAGALEDAANNVQLEAALALASLGDARAEPRLLTALQAGERVIEAAESLARLGCKRAREPLAKIALSWLGSPAARAATGAALTKLGDPRGVRALRRVLHALRGDARSYAVELTRDLGVNDFVEDLAKLAQRPRGADLLTVVDALGSYAPSSPEARAALESLAARDDSVGHAARELVQRTGRARR